MYTPEQLYDKKWLRVKINHWDAFDSFLTNRVYQAAGFCNEDPEGFHLDHLVIYCSDGTAHPVWVGWLEPVFDNPNPTKEEIKMIQMLGYQIPKELLNE